MAPTDDRAPKFKDERQTSRRFYKAVAVAEVAGGFGVTLDARTLRTPSGAVFLAPTRALAEACAAEWNAQGERIVPATMPVTQLAFAAIDWARPAREARVDFIASYGQTDLCCHRAETPKELAERQAASWQPLVSWVEATLGVSLPVVNTIVAADVSPATLAALRARALTLDDFRLTALSQATALAGSVIIGFALLDGRLDAAQAYEVSTLDDQWSLERWGEDGEARARLLRVREEFEGLGAFLQALA